MTFSTGWHQWLF